MRIGIIIPMDIEYRQMRQLLGGDQGVLSGNEIVLWRSGIGKVNAALGTQRLINECHPDCVLNTGVAGGIDVSLRVMDVVIANEVVYHDVWCGEDNAKGQVQGLPERYACNEKLCQAAMSIQSSHPLHCGLICTGDQFITNDARLKEIKSDFPEGLAVEMEAAAIAQTCYLNQVPFMAIRVISDVPAEAKTYDDHVQQYNDFWAAVGDNSFQTIKSILQALPTSI